MVKSPLLAVWVTAVPSSNWFVSKVRAVPSEAGDWLGTLVAYRPLNGGAAPVGPVAPVAPVAPVGPVEPFIYAQH